MVDIYGKIDLKQNEAEFLKLHSGTSFPSSPTPVAGQLFYRSDENKVYYYNATAWTEVGSGGGGSIGAIYSETISTTAINWYITHNLETAVPLVQVFNASNEVIEPANIIVEDANNITVEWGLATAGTVVVVGAAIPPTNSIGKYTEEFENQTEVVVTHNLDDLNVLVQVIDTSGDTVLPVSVVRNTNNQVTVTFGSSQTGTIVVQGGLFSASDTFNLQTEINQNASDISALQLENAEQQIEIIELQANTTVTPLDHDTLIADTFSDSTGYNNTVNTTNTTVAFSTNRYIPGLQNGGAYTDGTSTTGWTSTVSGSGSFSVSSGWLLVNCPAGDAHANDATAITDNDIFAVSNYVKTVIRFYCASSGGIPYSIAYLEDGLGASYELANYRNAAYDVTRTFTFHKDGTSLYVYSDGSLQTTIDLTTWGSSIYIRISAINGANSSDASATYLDYIYNTNSSYELLYNKSGIVEVDLPSITGTVTDAELVVNASSGVVSYDITDGTNTDSSQSLNVKNTLTNLTSNPTKVRINMPGVEGEYCKTYCLKLWKA